MTSLFQHICICCLTIWLGGQGSLYGQSPAQTLSPLERNSPQDVHAKSHYGKQGQLREKYQYFFDHWSEQEVKHGLHSKWDAEGKLIFEAEYWEGQLDGWVRNWRSGRLVSEEQWVQGQQQGVRRRYFLDGQVKKETPFDAGIKSGVEKRFWPSGKLKSARVYLEGRIKGKKEHFDREGKPRKSSPTDSSPSSLPASN